MSSVSFINNSSLQAEDYLKPGKFWYHRVANMKLTSLVAILILTVQQSCAGDMPSPAIKFDKRPFQIYPIDIAAHGKVI